MNNNFDKLKSHILSLSNSKEFSSAKKEWKLYHVELSDEFDQCPCGQQIKEICYIKNTINENTTHVGNVCVKQFIGIDTGNLFDGLKRIIQDIDANPNEDLIMYSFELGYIFESEYKFLNDIKRKRNFSERQTEWKRKINRRIINKIKVR